jgi:hypothetical protein
VSLAKRSLAIVHSLFVATVRNCLLHKIGPHKFAVCDPTPPTTTFMTAPSPYYISVQDNVLPFSAETNFTNPLQAIWNSPMRGLVLALGFVEEGPYAELRCRNEPLSRDCIQDVALLSYLLTKWNNERQKQQAVSATLRLEQPVGADGFGQSGLGRGGQIKEGILVME